ncbi:hypothetical protein [Nocardia aurantiaca]|nr:hypothetical protein [Nocardia aurantiaca]
MAARLVAINLMLIAGGRLAALDLPHVGHGHTAAITADRQRGCG